MKKEVVKTPVYVGNGDCVTPYGGKVREAIQGIVNGKSAIAEQQIKEINPEPFYGAITDKNELEIAFNLLDYKGNFTILEKLMLVAVDSIVKTHQSAFNERWGLIISTTKGNIDALSTQNEEEYFPAHLARKIGNSIGIQNEPIVISNACVSGILAISVAKRMIQSKTFDHVIVLSGDLFSNFVFKGFQSFHAVSNVPCRPYDEARDGITLGEASAAILVTNDYTKLKYPVYFEVVGDSSINDANHISGPSRTGEGLFQSIRNAMNEAHIEAEEIDCISAHGTATLYNDEMEGKAFNRIALQNCPTYSLKGYFGHTLGSAGLLETVIALDFAQQNLMPPSLGYTNHGLTVPLHITQEFERKSVRIILKTASGFGGSNTAVLFKKIVENEE